MQLTHLAVVPGISCNLTRGNCVGGCCASDPCICGVEGPSPKVVGGNEASVKAIAYLDNTVIVYIEMGIRCKIYFKSFQKISYIK
jgi:hypothetical protein